MGRKKKTLVEIPNETEPQTTTYVAETTTYTDGTNTEFEGDIVLPVEVKKEYPIPSTKEDYLALHKCLKDSGVNSIGDLEVKASKL